MLLPQGGTLTPAAARLFTLPIAELPADRYIYPLEDLQRRRFSEFRDRLLRAGKVKLICPLTRCAVADGTAFEHSLHVSVRGREIHAVRRGVMVSGQTELRAVR